MRRNFDPMSVPWGHLVPVKRLANGMIEYRCTKEKPDGTICGATRNLHQREARKYNSCAGCGRDAQNHNKRGKPKLNLTAEQKERYLEILNGREGGEAAREALELLSIELRNGPGVCCKVCAKRDTEAA